ncbi:hypothetical protein J1N35_018511, partial [Gossypium stocksii]
YRALLLKLELNQLYLCSKSQRLVSKAAFSVDLSYFNLKNNGFIRLLTSCTTSLQWRGLSHMGGQNEDLHAGIRSVGGGQLKC